MSELEVNSETAAQIGGGRASVESISEFLKEFKSARMSFEPLDTWLFVKARDDSGNDIESVSDCNDVSATNESDSSTVYHFDSDEVSSCASDDDDVAVDDCDKGCGKKNTLTLRNLANSPGRSGNSVKVFSEADQSDVFEDDDYTSPDVSVEYNSVSQNRVESVQKCIADCHQPALNSVFSIKSRSVIRSYNNYEGCADCVPLSTDEHVAYRTNKCYRDIYNDCDILDTCDSSSEKTSEFAVDTSSVSRRHINQDAVNIELPVRAVCDDNVAECNSTDVDSKTDIDDTWNRKKKRQRIAQELIETETTYQRHLELILQV